MTRFMSRALYALLFLAFISAGCDSGGDSDDDEDDDGQAQIDPTFNISSVGVTCDSGVACLQFEAVSTRDVALTRVNITNPRNQQEIFNANDNVFLAGERIQLQASDVAYTRVSGNWTFRFTGDNREGNGGRFDVSQSLPVGAFRPEVETEER